MPRPPSFVRPILQSLCALLCVFVCHVPAALAEKADRDKPINFQGDSLGGNTDTKISDLVGNVVVTQGTLTIHADRIQFHQTAVARDVASHDRRKATGRCAAWRLAMMPRFEVADFAHGSVGSPQAANGV